MQEIEFGRKIVNVRLLVGMLISIVCVYLIVRQVDINEVGKAISNLNIFYAAVGVLSLGMGYYIRIARWAVMLRASGADVRTRSCASPFLGSIALNNILPFRAGDFVRAFVFPKVIGVRKVTATASLLLERLVDLLTLLLCLSIGLLLSDLLHIPPWLEDSVTSLSIVGVTTLLSVILFHGFVKKIFLSLQDGLSKNEKFIHGRLAYLLGVGAHLLADLGVMSRLPTLIAIFVLSMLVWSGEMGLFLGVLYGLQMKVSLATALLIMSIATLSTLVPSSPGYVGPFHLATFTAVTMLGGDSSQAASFAILVHLGLWLPTTIVGGIAILLHPQLFKSYTTEK